MSKNYPKLDQVREELRTGIARNPDAVWVVRETDVLARELLEGEGVEPVLAPLVPCWKRTYELDGKKQTLDNRRLMRDDEIRRCCRLVVVFSDGGASQKWWEDHALDAVGKPTHVKIVKMQKPKKRRTGRKPVGV